MRGLLGLSASMRHRRQRTGAGGFAIAATIWCSAAVGVLAGAGYIPAAAIGAGLILVAHLGLRPIARRVDRLPATTETEVETLYTLRAVCKAGKEAHIRALVVQALTRSDFVLHSPLSKDLNAGGNLVEVTAEFTRDGRDDVAIEAVVSQLSLEPSVSSVTWNATEPAALLSGEE